MKKLSVSVLALVFILTMMLSGCGSNPGSTQTTADGSKAQAQTGAVKDAKPVELRVSWWGSQNRADRTTKLIQLYMQKYPNIKINPEYTSWDEYWNKMSVEAAGASLADVMQQDEAYLTQYGDKNLLLDLNSYSQNGILDLSDVNQQMLQNGIYNGKLIAISLGLNALGLMYDPAMFQKAGIEVPNGNWTWKDFEDNIIKLHEKLGAKVYGAAATWNNLDYFWMYVKQAGQHMINPEGTALAYDDKIFIDFMNISLRLRKAGAVPTIEEASAVAGLEDDPLVHGTAAMNLNLSSNEFVAISEAANRPLALTLSPAGATEGRVMKNSQYFSVTAGSKNPEEAARFISYFTNDIEANKLLLGERGVPFAAKVRKALEPIVSDAQKTTFAYVDVIEGLKGQVDPIYPPNYGGLYDVWKNVTDEIMYGKTSPEDGAKKFRAQSDEILGKNKK